MTAAQARLGRPARRLPGQERGIFDESQPEAEADGSGVDTGMEVTVREHDDRTRMLIVHGGLPAAGVWDEFAGGWASILDGLGRAVAARVTDRS